MPTKPPLNDRQLQVLGWIRDGCPDGVMDGHSHKITAVALQNRSLVRVTRKGGQWAATITESGRTYLREGGWPAEAAESPATTTAPAQEIAPNKTTRQSNAVHSKASRVPSERHDGSAAEVPVPARLTRPLPAVVAVRDATVGVTADPDGRLDLRSRGVLPLHVSRASLPRALRLLEAIGREAARRGWQLRADPPTAGYGRTRAVIGRGSASLAFQLFEETDKTPHEPTKVELADLAKYSWTRIPKYDHTASGRLRLKLDGYGLKRTSFGDGVRQRLEDLLPEEFAIIEQVFDAQDAAEQARQLAEQERRRQMELARERAYLRVKYDHKATAARDQAQQWREAALLRDYATAIRQQQAEPAAQDWAAWILAHADELDPLADAVRIPDEREPTWSEISRYLPAGWY